MKAGSVKLLGAILAQGFIWHVAVAKDVACLRQEEAACLVTEAQTFPWSDERSKPAPVVECMSASVEYNEEGSSDSGIRPTLYNIQWKQKRADINGIEGYFIVSTSLDGGPDQYELKLDKEKLWNDGNSDENYITFNFREIEYFDHGAVYLYSMPLYNDESKDHYHRITRDESGLHSSKNCNPRLEEASAPPTSQSTTTGKVMRIVSTKTDQVPLNVTILACILTSVGTLLLLLAIFIIFVSPCKLMGCLRVTARATRVKDQYFPGQREINRKRRSKVFIMATMAEEEDHYTSVKSHKMAALGLAEILCDSNLYEVNCNLWMTKEISHSGVGIWAHRMMKSHDVIIALCHKFTVVALRRWLNSDTHNEELAQDTDPSVQVLQRFISSLSPDKTKIIVCMEDSVHDCLAELPLPSLETWKSFNLNCQFAEFIVATHGKGQCIDESKIASMRLNFLQMIMKTKTECHSRVFNKVNDGVAPFSKHERMSKESNQQTQTRSKTNSGLSTLDVQYDSVFSSRCNSHSTDTLSSCEDTEFHENDQKQIKHDLRAYKLLEARNAIARTTIDCSASNYIHTTDADASHEMRP